MSEPLGFFRPGDQLQHQVRNSGVSTLALEEVLRRQPPIFLLTQALVGVLSLRRRPLVDPVLSVSFGTEAIRASGTASKSSKEASSLTFGPDGIRGRPYGARLAREDRPLPHWSPRLRPWAGTAASRGRWPVRRFGRGGLDTYVCTADGGMRRRRTPLARLERLAHDRIVSRWLTRHFGAFGLKTRPGISPAISPRKRRLGTDLRVGASTQGGLTGLGRRERMRPFPFEPQA